MRVGFRVRTPWFPVGVASSVAISGLALVALPHELVPAAAAVEAAPNSPMSQARASGQPVADRARWDATSRTTANPDGTWTTEVWSGPVNFRDVAGEWQAIDTTLVPSSRQGFAVESKAGPAKVLVPSDAGMGPVRVEDQRGRWLSFKLSAAVGVPAVRESSATVADGPGPSQVRYDAIAFGVKESITLPAAPTAAPVYSFDLKTATGLNPSLTASRDVVFSDAGGMERFRMPAPFMQDATGEPSGLSTAVAVALTPTPSGWRLTLSPDLAWLQDAARVYPVVVDPTTTTINAPSRDTFLAEDTPGTATGNQSPAPTWLRVGSLSGAGSSRRALVGFTIPPSTIPSQASVSSAFVSLYLASTLNATPDQLAVRAMNRATTPPTSTTTTWSDVYAKWVASGTGTTWTGGSPFFDGTSGTAFAPSVAAGYKAWNVTDIVTGWLANPALNNGFLVKATGEPSPNEYRFQNGASTNPNKPRLSITWTTAPPSITAGSLKITSPVVTSGGGTVARTLTPTFTATAKDPDSFDIGYSFKVLNAAGAVVAQTPAGSSRPNSAPGSAVSFGYTVPAGVLTDGGTYTVRFAVSDETTSEAPTAQLGFLADQAPLIPSQLQVDPIATDVPLVTPVVDPVLSAIITDPGATDLVTALFEVRPQTPTNDAVPVQTGTDEVTTGDRAYFAVLPPDSPTDSKALQPGAPYQFRVGSQDAVNAAESGGAKVNWSGWVEFTVAKDAHVSKPLTLEEPLTIWDTGADLTWTAYRDPATGLSGGLNGYAVYRGSVTSPGGTCAGAPGSFDPTAPGLVKVAADLPPGTLAFNDRSAAPSAPAPAPAPGAAATYRYWVVAQTDSGAVASDPCDVTMPVAGRVRRVFLGSGPQATLAQAKPNEVVPEVLHAGNNGPTNGVERALLDFDTAVIKSGMRVTAASLQAAQNSTGVIGDFSVHRLVGHSFLPDQATWTHASLADLWSTPGGDFETTPIATTRPAATTGVVSFTDSATMRAAVQGWVDDPGTNRGVEIKAVNEASGGGWLDLVPTSATQVDQAGNELRPRLVVEHTTTSVMDTISAPDVPHRYVPNVDVTVPVRLTNTTDTAWPAGLQLSYRWSKEGQTADELTATSGRYTSLFPDPARQLQPGESLTVSMNLKNPINSDTGANLPLYDLYLDLWDPGTNKWWSVPTAGGGLGHSYYLEPDLTAVQRQARDDSLGDQVCTLVPTGLECPHRVVQSPTSSSLGLEKFGSYAGEETGAGSQALVNLNAGNLVWSYDAFQAPSVGPAFFLRVAYNAQDRTPNTQTGYGWSVQPATLARLNSTLVDTGTTQPVVLTDGDGTEHTWRNSSNAGTVTTYTNPAGIHLALDKDTSRPAEEWYRFKRPDGTTFYFGSNKLPSKVVDINNNVLRYNYAAGRLDNITDSKTRKVARLGYDAQGRLAWVAGIGHDNAPDLAYRALAFDYSTANPDQLAGLRDGADFNTTTQTFANPGLVKTFGFTYSNSQTNGHTVLTQVTDPLNQRTRFGYYETPDPQNPADINNNTYPSRATTTVPTWVMGKVRSLIDRTGQTSQYEYYHWGETPTPADFPDGASLFARVLDVNGTTADASTYGLDAYGRTIMVKDANANAADAAGETKDNATTLTWDADHNVVRLREPNGAVSRWVYNPQTGYPKRSWDPEAVRTGGNPTSMSYTTAPATGAVTLASITAPRGKKTTFASDDRGRLTQVTDPTGGLTRYTYNDDGTLLTAIQPKLDNGTLDAQRTTSYAYPAGTGNLGYPKDITPPTSTVAPGDSTPDAPTSFEYDPLGNVVKTTRTATIDGVARTLVTTAGYDGFGRPTTLTSPGAQGPDRTTSYTYDLNDNLKTETAANQAVTSYTYRPDDQVETTQLPANGSTGVRRIAYGYDPLGRLCREVQPKAYPTGGAGCPAGANDAPPAYAIDYRYDHVGQLLSVTQADPAQAGSVLVTSYGYDRVGNLAWVRDPRTNRTDVNGAANAKTNEYVYDLDHRNIAVIDAVQATTRTGYDADGHVITSLDQAGKPTTYTYDDAGRLKTTSVLYNPPGGDPRKWTTTNDYDPAGNLIKVTRPRVVKHGTRTVRLFTLTHYDENNRPYQSDGAYDDDVDVAVYQTASYKTPVKQYLSYDAFGRLDRQSIPTRAALPTPTAAGQWARFAYYDSGDILTSTDPTGIATGYEYNTLGQQTERTLTGANASGSPTTNTRTMSWSYFADGSLRNRVDAASTAPAVLTDNPATTSATPSTWVTVTPTARAGQYASNYLAHGKQAGSTDTVTWQLTPPASGKYRVQYSCPAVTKDASGQPIEPTTDPRASSVDYNVTYGATSTTMTGDHSDCGDHTWRNLGLPITSDATSPVTVKLAPSGTGVVVADAIRLLKVADTPSGPAFDRGFSHAYDANGQQTSVTDTSNDARITSVVTGFDSLGRPNTVEELNGVTTLRRTGYAYDLNSNIAGVTSNRWTQTGAPEERNNLDLTSSTSYTWDPRNLLKTVTTETNAGTTPDPAAQRQWVYEWNKRGLLGKVTKPGPPNSTAPANVTTYTYYDNRLLRQQTETRPKAGTYDDVVIASHVLTYNEDGDPQRDIAKIQHPSSPTAVRAQNTVYGYTPSGQISQATRSGIQAGDDETYVYLASGSLDWQRIDKVKTTYTYDGDRLKTATPSVGAASTYNYDDFGRLRTITSAGTTTGEYTYDGFDRIVSEAQTAAGSPSTTTTKAYDPLDRVSTRTVTAGTKTSKTRYSYLGLTKTVAAEEQTDATHPWQITKTYATGPTGNPLAVTSTPLTGPTKSRYYTLNAHGDVEALTEAGTGATDGPGLSTATYRYTAYGSPDDKGTLGEDKKPPTPDPTANVLNPYRYSSKRIDPSGSYDMGFRTYNPGLNSFLSRDMYNGALADMRLGLDPWATNRYAFAGGNPISRTDLDGHMPAPERRNDGSSEPVPEPTVADAAPSMAQQIASFYVAGPFTGTNPLDSRPSAATRFLADLPEILGTCSPSTCDLAELSAMHPPAGVIKDDTAQIVGAIVRVTFFDDRACHGDQAGFLACLGQFAQAAPIGKIGKLEKVAHALGGAAKGADEVVALYRHFSPGELADIGENGFRPGAGSLDGKWFAESGEHASQWGTVLNGGSGSVVKVRVPTSFGNQLMRLEKLDGIGPARYVEPHQLAELNRYGWELW